MAERDEVVMRLLLALQQLSLARDERDNARAAVAAMFERKTFTAATADAKTAAEVKFEGRLADALRVAGPVLASYGLTVVTAEEPSHG